MSEIVDLDVVMPQSAIIKYGNEEITIQPLTVSQTIKLGFLTDALRDNWQTDSQLEKTVEDLTLFMYKQIPQLSGKPLNKVQLQLLVDAYVTLNTPKQKENLEEQGITTDATPKAPQD